MIGRSSSKTMTQISWKDSQFSTLEPIQQCSICRISRSNRPAIFQRTKAFAGLSNLSITVCLVLAQRVQFSISHMTLETRLTAPGVTSMSLKEVSYQTSTNRQDLLQIQHSIQLHAIRTCTIQEQSVLVVQDTIQGHPNVPQRSFLLI